MENRKIALIIGAGPAGLTAAYELLDKTEIIPIVLEASDEIGGISRTVAYKGNRLDIGGHRFFSQSDQVLAWWLKLVPLQCAPAWDDRLLERPVAAPPIAAPVMDTCVHADPEKDDVVMLVRNRLSRIFFMRKFFNYPVTLSRSTIANFGVIRMIKITASYLRARIFPIKPVVSLADYYTNQFGAVLYRTFFQDYTHKIWGVPCEDIPAEWGAQRVKGLSLAKILRHALKNILPAKATPEQPTETSLIESFLYPKYGPGQLWETAAAQVEQQGGEVRLHTRVVGIINEGDRITGVEVEDQRTGERITLPGDYLFSSMPIRDLITAFRTPVPAPAQRVAAGLHYRDFMTVGVLTKRLLLENQTGIKTVHNIIPDNWIYIQEADVRVGRLQLFNNWSPYMVADPDTVWVGMEYFCTEGDEMWCRDDAEFMEFAISELASIGMIDPADVLDSTIIRVRKAYPAYFGTYSELQVVRDYTDQFENLFLIGRNGMHRYNNMDHSMLTAMAAVQCVAEGTTDKERIWSVNTEDEYHERRKVN